MRKIVSVEYGVPASDVLRHSILSLQKTANLEITYKYLHLKIKFDVDCHRSRYSKVLNIKWTLLWTPVC